MPRRGVSIDYTRRTALYRLFDSAGRLLYVGITFNPSDRWRGHSGTKSWWKDVTRREVEWHTTRSAAERAETTAITDERPLYNVAGVDGETTPSPVKVKRGKHVGCDEACEELTTASDQWRRSKAEFQEADAELRALLRQARAQGVGPSDMARWSGMTREWVAKIAPLPKS
jgi:hypothetical protein